jgi:hypothetical protein
LLRSEAAVVEPAAEQRILRIFISSPSDGPSATPVTLPGSDNHLIAFSGDNQLLTYGNSDRKTVNVWNLRLDELMVLACRTAGRNLTKDEITNYQPGEPGAPTCTNLAGNPF